MTAGQSLVLIAAALAVCGCSQMGPSKDAVAKERYQAYGPRFSQEEIDAMSLDQKLAIYNYNVPENQQLICRNELPLGTHFKAIRCWTREEFELQRRAAEDFMRAAKRGAGGR